MSGLSVKTKLGLLSLAMALLASSPQAFAQAFLEPASSLNVDAPTAAEAPVFQPQSAYPSYQSYPAQPAYQYHPPARGRFSPMAADLDALNGASSSLPGAPFTDDTRAQIAQSASSWINANIDAGADSRYQQVLKRDNKIDQLLARDKAKLGSNYAVLEREDQLIRAQDFTLKDLNGGRDISKLEQSALNKEETALTKQIQALTGP